MEAGLCQVTRTSNEMCSLPNLISSSCFPSLFFWGHFVSSSFMISLSFIIFLISEIIKELTHTRSSQWLESPMAADVHTLFTNKGIIPVIGVICVSSGRTSSITHYTEIELEKLCKCQRRIAIMSVRTYHGQNDQYDHCNTGRRKAH